MIVSTMIRVLYLSVLSIGFVLLLPTSVSAQVIASPSPGPTPKSSEEIDPDDVIRVNTALVNSPVLVTGRNGKFIPTLRMQDFEVYEEGIKQNLTYFSPVESPYTFLILIDTSRSVFVNLEDIKSSAIAFVRRMRPNDKAIVVTFSDEIDVASKATGDHLELEKLIQRISPGGASRVYDAMSLALKEQLEKRDGRKALLLFSDGVDNASRDATFDSTIKLAQRSEVLIHPVQLGTYEAMRKRTRSRLQLEGSGFSDRDYLQADRFLHQLADISSTGVYPALNISDLDRVVSDIVDELHNEYNIGYYPQTKGTPGEVRTIEIKVKQPQLKVRARGGYVVDQSGSIVRSTASSAKSLTLSERANVIPIPLDDVRVTRSPGARWICKGPNVQTDLAVVKEATVAQCPKASEKQGNAWYVRTPSPKETICKGFLMWNGKEVAAAPIPYQYVVTGESTSSSCSRSQKSSELANAWSIQKPSSGLSVCKGFPLPRGFVSVGERFSSGCPSTSTEYNAWIIRAK